LQVSGPLATCNLPLAHLPQVTAIGTLFDEGPQNLTVRGSKGMIALFVRFTNVFGIKPKEAERFFKFLVVGTIGFVVDFGTLSVLKEVVGLETLVANTISFTAAVISNFIWNRFWTYPDSRQKSVWAQLGQFGVVSIIGLAINNFLVVLLETPFEQLTAMTPLGAERGYIPAKMVATIVVLFWNFFVNRFWTFNDVE
jgi:putative flippase GtrA